jgi:di/tricarboxylate transporter
MPLRFGDALLLYGPREKLNLLAADRDFLVLTEATQEPPRSDKAPYAALILAAILISVGLGWLHVSIAAVIGAALMVVSGSLTMEEAYSAIEWRAVFLIAGMLPLGIALERTGAAPLLAEGVIGSVGQMGPIAVISVLFAITSLGAQLIPPAAMVVLMAPIALDTAARLEISAYALMMVVAVSAAASFMSPITHPANIMIMGPGGYRFIDYTKVGLPLTLVVLAVVLLVLPVVWPLSGK